MQALPQQARLQLGGLQGPPPLLVRPGGGQIPHSIPVSGEGVWACIPKMGTEVMNRCLNSRNAGCTGTSATSRGRCALGASNLG